MMKALIALKKAAALYQVPFELLRAICTVESNLNPDAHHKNDGHSDSYGMCQVKHATAVGFGFKGLPPSLFDSYTNAVIAAQYLSYQLYRYGGDQIKAISAYNAGRYIKSNDKYVVKVCKALLKEINYVGSRYQNQEYSYCLRKLSNGF